MNRRKAWLKRGLYVFGAGLVISVSMTAIVQAAIGGWIVLSPAMWWGVMAGLILSWLCPVAGIVLAMRGLITSVKK
jgi:heme A synthase